MGCSPPFVDPAYSYAIVFVAGAVSFERSMNTIACETCGLVQQLANVPPRHLARCARCDGILQRNVPNSRARTAALTLAALCLYVPANIYPIMIMDYMGLHTQNTVLGSVRALYRDGMWAVAVLVF